MLIALLSHREIVRVRLVHVVAVRANKRVLGNKAITPPADLVKHGTFHRTIGGENGSLVIVSAVQTVIRKDNLFVKRRYPSSTH